MDMKLSIVMTTYNGGEYISEQLKSILEQSRVPDEILIVDDGSTDGTLNTLYEYSSRHPNLIDIYENDRNLGVEKNFEKGLRLATGDIIAIADQDDIWNEKKIEKQESYIKNKGVDLVFHDAFLFSENAGIYGSLWNHLGVRPSEYESSSEFFRNLLTGNFVQGASMAFRQEILEYCLPIPKRVKYDYFTALSVSGRRNIGVIDEPLAKYRQHEDQDVGVGPVSVVDRLFSYSLPTKSEIIDEIESNILAYETFYERLPSEKLSEYEKNLLDDAEKHYKKRLELYRDKNSISTYPILNSGKYRKYDNLNKIIADVAYILLRCLRT